MNGSPPLKTRPLSLLSIVIPARDEEGCICSTVEHLHLELRLRNVPHEIIVVDDGSLDRTWNLLGQSQPICQLIYPGMVGRLGIEPRTGGTKIHCSAN